MSMFIQPLYRRGLKISFWRRQWHPTPVLLPGKSHGRRSLVGCNPWGCEEWDTTEWPHFHFSLSCIGEGNGNPLQCSCLENPRDWGAWWAAVYGVAHSRTRLKWLSSRRSHLVNDLLIPSPKCSGNYTPSPDYGGFPGGASSQEPTCQCRRPKRRRLDPCDGKIPSGGGRVNPLQYSCLKNPMDRGAWRATVHRVTQSQTQLKRLSTHAHILDNGTSPSCSVLPLFTIKITSLAQVTWISLFWFIKGVYWWQVCKAALKIKMW